MTVLAIKFLGNDLHRAKEPDQSRGQEFARHLWILNVRRPALRAANDRCGNVGIGFAIPSNQAKEVYSALKEKGKITRGWLGVSIMDASKAQEIVKDEGYTGTDGVLVQEVLPETPAHGKLNPGDVILTGTPPGVGAFRKPPIYLQHNDIVEVEIEGIGVLRNPVAIVLATATALK